MISKLVYKINNKNLGFTLVEMLVVISIIGILSAVLAGNYINSQRSSRDAARKINLKSISDALNSYYADNGVFPEEDDLRNSQNTFSKDGIVYMKLVPNEIGQMKSIVYKVSDSNKSFRLFSNLENEEDKDCVSKTACSLLGYDIDNDCCYIVTSSNVGTTAVLP